MRYSSLMTLTRTTIVASLLLSKLAMANTTLDFEDPLPYGLAPTYFTQDSHVGSANLIGDNFLYLGISATGAALVQLGYGHAPSGINGLSGITNSGVDYGSGYSFEFFSHGNKSTKGVTDYFSITPDRGGYSSNTITLTAYDINGVIVGTKSVVENVPSLGPVELSGIGKFHKVSVNTSLSNRYGGGIGMDLVTFGSISTPVTPVPEPETYAMLLAGLGLIGGVVRRRKQQVTA